MNPARNPKRQRLLRGFLSLVISAGLLSVMLARLDPVVLRQAMAALNIPVMVFGFGMFGVFLILGSLRWRIAVRAAGLSVPLHVLLRAALVGHAFNMAFFGPVGGDLAKSAAYSRWHDYQLHDLLATAVIDRSFAAVGATLLATATVVVFLASTAVPSLDLSPASFDRLVLTALLVALVIAIVILRLRRRPFVQQLFGSFAEIARQLRQAPTMVLAGCMLGFTGQVIVSYLLLVCLVAVTYPQSACAEYLWAFPLIAAVSGLPVSIGGAGVREGMGVLLLGACAVAPEPVVIAGLLVLGIYVSWAILGLPVFLWEEHQHARRD